MVYKKAYDIVQQSWIIDGLKLYKISDEDRKIRHANNEKQKSIHDRKNRPSK